MKKKNKHKGLIIAVIIVSVLAVAIFIFSKMKKNPGVLVETDKVVRTDIEQTVDVKGTVEGTDKADVYSNSTRRIAEILVKEGDKVSNGENLARLEDDESTIEYEKAQIAYDNAKREYDSKSELYEVDAVTREEVLSAESALKNAELNLKQIEEDKKLFVTSPIDGTVTRIYASVGKLAGGNNADALFRIENIDQLQMKLRVSEYDIAKVAPGHKVRITSEVIGDEVVDGAVTSIAPTGEEKNPGSTNMVIPVTVAVDKGQSKLFAGVNAKATIITGEAFNVLAVPIDSIMEDTQNGEQYVFVVKDNILHRVNINSVLENDFYTAIEDTDGISEGDEVVLSPDYSMEEGTQVQIMPGF